jgi:aryl-alcohol dehydrogenase-like predicted oxidoreductase
MRYVQADGLVVSGIGLGAWQFGSREWGYGETYATVVAPALVRRAAELGITLIDTAELYGPGRSERIIGSTLAAMPAAERARLVIATKFMPIAPAEPILAWQAAGSRRRLGVEQLDLYYAHWPNPFVSVRRVMQAVRPLVAAGLVRRVGVSNYSVDQWRTAERTLRAPVVANQVRFSLLSPGPARDQVPYAAAAGRLVVAYSPLGQGLLSGAAAAGPVRGMRARNVLFRARGQLRIAPLVDAVREIAAAHDATSAQVALAWVLHHPNTVAIPGARTVEQLEENAAAADLVLSDAEFARLSLEAEALRLASGSAATRRK